ncbi:hypothetical protein AXF42_Ash019498 [Apostasia shenzhenica]|uniref:DNL-type domain-containing protein n=1 Tax=Apostasia shenzhenica TaxID=1088818 RepID=A0A2I0A086_9ASPA|nr:hypothetical protein AXF42_Ash019498 [Apostasia shenzhenica]
MGKVLPLEILLRPVAGSVRRPSKRHRSMPCLQFPLPESNHLPRYKPHIPSLQISVPEIKDRVAAGRSGQNLGEHSRSSPSDKEVSLNMNLPRRNMIVQFTCNSCGERTQRRINRIAYERGTVFVQCSGCMVNHKLVDNLGLVVEYDLREEVDT